MAGYWDIETSCDDAAACRARHQRAALSRKVLSSTVATRTTSIGFMSAIVPELASRNHLVTMMARDRSARLMTPVAPMKDIGDRGDAGPVRSCLAAGRA